MGAHGELTGEGKEKGERGRGAQLGWGAQLGGTVGALLGAAWLGSCVRLAIRKLLDVRKEKKRRKKERRKRKGRKRKEKNMENFLNLKISEK
jgi:hypothetical protein